VRQAVPRHTVVDGARGTRYLRRIVVREATLLCHGLHATRPAFVARCYAADRAFDFKVGDLCGVYSIFIPDAPLPEGCGGPGLKGAHESHERVASRPEDHAGIDVLPEGAVEDVFHPEGGLEPRDRHAAADIERPEAGRDLLPG